MTKQQTMDEVVAEVLASTPEPQPAPPTALARTDDKPQNEIAIIEGRIRPSTLSQVATAASWLIRAGSVPKSLEGRTPDETRAKIMLAIACGQTLGMDPMWAVANIMVVNNKPSLYGDALPALVYASKKIDGIIEEGWEDLAADGSCTDKTYAFARATRNGVKREVKFSVSDAKKAGLFGKPGPWTNYPKRMLQWRARSWLIRDLFPDVLAGMAVVEEQDDIPTTDGAKVRDLNAVIDTMAEA